MMSHDPVEQADNFALLDTCPRPVHHFVPIFKRGETRPVSGRCAWCSGTVSRSSAAWYRRGLRAGARDPEAALEALPPWMRSL